MDMFKQFYKWPDDKDIIQYNIDKIYYWTCNYNVVYVPLDLQMTANFSNILYFSNPMRKKQIGPVFGQKVTCFWLISVLKPVLRHRPADILFNHSE